MATDPNWQYLYTPYHYYSQPTWTPLDLRGTVKDYDDRWSCRILGISGTSYLASVLVVYDGLTGEQSYMNGRMDWKMFGDIKLEGYDWEEPDEKVS